MCKLQPFSEMSDYYFSFVSPTDSCLHFYTAAGYSTETRTDYKVVLWYLPSLSKRRCGNMAINIEVNAYENEWNEMNIWIKLLLFINFPLNLCINSFFIFTMCHANLGSHLCNSILFVQQPPLPLSATSVAVAMFRSIIMLQYPPTKYVNKFTLYCTRNMPAK